MAYVDPQDDEELQRQQQQNGLVIAGTDLSGADAGATTPGATTGAAVAPNQSPNQTSGFTDVAAYLNANKDQSAQMAGQIAGTLNTEYDKTRGDIDTAANAFKTSVDQNTVNPNADLVNKAAADPTGFAKNDSNLAAFKAQRDANYAGPSQFETDPSYAAVGQKITSAQQRAQLASDPTQRGQLLYSTSQNPTSGQVALDSLILGADPSAQATLSAAASKFPTLNEYLSGKSAGLDANAAQARATTAQAAALVPAAFGGNNGVVSAFKQGLSAKEQAAQAKANAYNSTLATNQPLAQANRANLISTANQDIDAINSSMYNRYSGRQGDIQAEEARLAPQFDVSKSLGDMDSWLNASAYQTPAGLANTASADDYAKDAALSQLLGGGYIPDLDPSQASQAGTFNVPNLPTVGTGDASGQIQYMNDLRSLYADPRGINYQGLAPNGDYQHQTPQDAARQALIAAKSQPASGSPEYFAAINRLIANQYAGR